MFVPDELRKCVAYIGYRSNTGETLIRGTGFFVTRALYDLSAGFYYLVTARHLLDKMAAKENFDGIILITVNAKNGTSVELESKYEDWITHPDDTSIDVAVLPNWGAIFSAFDQLAIPLNDMFLNETIRNENEISIGDELFLTGLFYNHRGRSRNIPIVRVGNIAAMPEEKVKTREMGFIDAYLVEARSIGGISGSPVFVTVQQRLKKGAIPMSTGNRNKEDYYLMGLIHGHYDIDLIEDSINMDAKTVTGEVVNMGIAIVVPSEKILEVIEQPLIREPEIQVEKNARENLAPTMDILEDDEPPSLTKTSYEDSLKKASRKISEHESEKKETSD